MRLLGIEIEERLIKGLHAVWLVPALWRRESSAFVGVMIQSRM